MSACLPVTVDGKGHGNPGTQGSTVSAGPIAKDHIYIVKHIHSPSKKDHSREQNADQL